LAENPALEVPEEDPCQGCDTPRSLCIDCSFRKNAEKDDPDISIHELEMLPVDALGDPDAENDFIANIEAEVSLQDHLRTLLRAVLPDDQYEVGEYLVSNINDTGYLDCKVEEVALELAKTIEDVEAVLAIIQTFEPAGVGARDLQECMRIQLDQLKEDGQGNPIAHAIVRDYWDDMIAKRVGRLARRLKVSQTEILDALAFIKTSLNPYPGNAFRTPWSTKPNDAGSAIRPDVIVRRTVNGFEVDVVTHEQYALTINSHYRTAYSALKSGGTKGYSEDERKHITEFVERADLFIKNLNQRRRTLRLITKAIIEYQQGYLDTGSKMFVRALTRTKVARALKMHESTVSRATANKYVMLPSEEVVPFDFFFDTSTSVKDLIGEMISKEDPRNPLSDQEIADLLQERGLNVARRTVVKYREAQKILSSRQRRR
jgi:RNA polymerase sigma-54 factor